MNLGIRSVQQTETTTAIPVRSFPENTHALHCGGGTFLSPGVARSENIPLQFGGQECPPSAIVNSFYNHNLGANHPGTHKNNTGENKS